MTRNFCYDLGTKYLRRVVDNVLDLSKLEEGKLEVESEPFELIHVVDAVIAQLEVESEPFELIHEVDAVIAQEHENASDKGLQVFCSVEPQCADVIVKGDKHRVQQIVANFFRNAVEYTQQGWVEVQLYKASGEVASNKYGRDALAGRLVPGQQTGQRTGQGRKVSADGEEIFPFVFCVADSGPGLSEEQRQHVFSGMDPSLAPAISSGASDTESRSSSTPEGWGLSLIVSQKLAFLMNGTLSCDSAIPPPPKAPPSFCCVTFPPLFHLPLFPSSSSAPAGSGLGLIVSQKLASLMHGTLSCHSTLSQGSSFRLSLSLPFAGRSNHADPADAGADMAAGHASLAPGGMMSCYLSNRVKGVVYSSVGVWSSAEEIAAAPVVPPTLSRSLPASLSAPTGMAAGAAAAGRVQTGAGLSGAGSSGAAHVMAGMAGMTLTGAHPHGVSTGAAAVVLSPFSSTSTDGDDPLTAAAAAAISGSTAEDADVDAAALAAIVELEAAYGGRVMVQVLREVVDFREVAASAMAAMATLLPALSSAAVSASFSTVSSRSKSLACEPLTFSMRSLRLAVPQAATTTAPVVELAADVAEATSAVEELPLQSAEDIKVARKEEQRRKRLVQKRKLRKKGRWPPSKMKQHQNV
ncbi:unnamed protein product [Closterium sp. Naga37s-1]|nr:unnamed protein product [Closterium sp. Naga37s-1]